MEIVVKYPPGSEVWVRVKVYDVSVEKDGITYHVTTEQPFASLLSVKESDCHPMGADGTRSPLPV